MTKNDLTLAAVGCSGQVAQIFVEGFLQAGIKVRILARDQAAVSTRYPGAEVIHGSMMNAQDVAKVMTEVDAAFVVTPMGMRNDMSAEVSAARAVIAGAKSSKLRHLIYTSVLGADQHRGVGILDAKYEIERLLAGSGVPWTALRCGSYMEDVFDMRLGLLNKGKFLFPVNKDRRFTYTSQSDVPRFVVSELLEKQQILNRPFNFVTPGTFSVHDVERRLSDASGISIKAARKFPSYYMFLALLPIFYLRRNRFSSIVPLMRYFDRCGYADAGNSVQDLFPEFRMTTLEEHFRKLWAT